MHWPVQLRFPRRQAILFLIAILVPCGVLLTMGLQMMDQERQLQDKRLTDEHLRLVERVREEVSSELEKIKLRQLTLAVARGGIDDVRPEGAVAFVGAIQDGRLQLPWEHNPAAKNFKKSLSVGPFADAIRQAENMELIERQYENAARRYRVAIDAATVPAEQSYARLLLARTLESLKQRRESQLEYERVLASPPDLVDEHGVPIGFYAAEAMLLAGVRHDNIIERIRTATEGERLLPPVALGIAGGLAAKLGASELASSLADSIRDREQANALERDWARVIPVAQSGEPVWVAYGEPAWLTSVTPPAGILEGLVVAVRASDLLKQVNRSGGQIRVATPADAVVQSLGENFLGFRVVIPAPDESASGSRQSFLAVALLLSLMFTTVAGYLLWRDVQRDLRLSEMRSQFVSSVSHELKTPLTAIRMFTETLRLDADVDTETRSGYLDTVLHESERLSRLVDNVLDFGKIERDKKTYRFQPVRLDETVESAARAVQYPLEQAGFALETAIDSDLPPFAADCDALQQAILNLLSNAMKYSGDSRRIALRLERKNGQARIQVMDQGIGMAPEEQKHVFERFYRAPAAVNAHIPGTGLGLTIVAHIARAHGGGVEIVSSPGAGSSFTIWLPLNPEAAARARL